ncbi:RICIN domain-containing protein [Streptomyces sp. CBMA156]|uniref:RICIN domain-containing protein n=1 Tax=Streptomyces sp. CBMA156 TaxID=1930280 RepID=UPI001661958B|nr:RICIN domain-containing protein [Streptomyces sp. CBMA156]MBD0676897.1 hypothetical protein [Streptomyces sp. CBMA156]
MRFLSIRRVLSVLVPALAGLALFPAAASADTPATVLFNQFSQRCPNAASGYQTMHPCAPSDNPGMWVISRLASDRYIIADARGKGCLTAADAPVVQTCSLSDTRQQWDITRYEPEAGRYGLIGVRIRSVSRDWCLDNSKKTFGGWEITQRPCLDDTHQQWDIDRAAYQALWGNPLHASA